MTARLEPLTGFEFHPAAGLVPLDEFYGALADRVFHSTQYLRHPSSPLYTPEPDIVHEVIGHGNLLADPQIATVKRLAGEAARRCETAEGLQYLADVFWFTIEFGVMHEEGELRCYGAGLLSSFGEIDEFRAADIRPIDFHVMATLEYDITRYQPILFACDGMGELTDSRRGLLRELRRRHARAARARRGRCRRPETRPAVRAQQLEHGGVRQPGRDAARRGRSTSARRPERVQHRLLGRVDGRGEERVELRVRQRLLGRAAADLRARPAAAVANARKISPLPWCATEPVRPRPSPARRASRVSCAGASGASVATTAMQLPAGAARARLRRPAARGRPARRRRAGPAPRRSSRARARRRSRRPRARAGSPCRCRPSSRSRSCPVPAPTAPSATAPPRACASARPASAASTCTTALSESQLSSHSPTTGITTSSVPTAGIGGDRRGDGAVEDAPDRHRRREVDRRLDQPPLRDRDEAGHLPRAVEHRRPGGHRLAEEPVGGPGQDRGHAGARDPAAAGLVAPDRDVADPHAGDVGDRVRRPGSSAPIRSPSSRRRGPRGAGGPDTARTLRPAACRLAAPMAADPLVWSDAQRLHDPAAEIWVGVRTPAVEVAARADAIRAELERAGHPVVAADAAARRGARGGARPRAARLPRRRVGATGRRPGCPTTPARTASCRTSSRTPGCSGTLAPALPGRDLGAHRALRVRHDDADRPGHVGGGARRGRRGADRRRAGARRRARRVRLLPPARPPRDAQRLRRLLLPQQRARSPPRGCATALGGPVALLDVDAHHGNGAQSIFYDRADVLTGSVHVDPGAGWFPHFLGFAGEDGEGAGRARTATSRSRPAAATTPWLAAVRRARATGRAASSRARSWSRSASTPPPATRRARCA